jgi:hypothetical protein
MPIALTDSAEVVANYILTKFQDPTVKASLGLQDVWYGDQDLMPHTPALCVTPGVTKREFRGATFRTLNTIETYVLVYWGKITDIQQNLHNAQHLADQVVFTVHSDLKLGGLVTAVLCTESDPGLINKAGVWMMGARLTFESISTTTFPQQVV